MCHLRRWKKFNSEHEGGAVKRIGYILLFVFFALALACAKPSFTTTTTTTTTSDTKTDGLKDNQVKGNLHTTNGDTGELTLLVDGVEKKYMRAKECKFFDEPEDTKQAPNLTYLYKRDVILTLEKKDGKELVTEIRGAPRTTKLTTKGTRVEGVCKGVLGATGEVSVVVNGVEKKYASDDYSRFYDNLGYPVRSQVGAAFFNVKVELAVDNKDGKDHVIEMRPLK
jgi:hypothetical protein